VIDEIVILRRGAHGNDEDQEQGGAEHGKGSRPCGTGRDGERTKVGVGCTINFGHQPSTMSRVEIKQAMIAKEVLNTTDEDLLDQLKLLLDRPRGDWWANLPAKVRRDVEESLAQADRGETVSHAEALKQVQAWRKR
jgi:hypothetical protein